MVQGFDVGGVPFNPDGWGPPDCTLNNVPYAPFSRSEKLGRIADWTRTFNNPSRSKNPSDAVFDFSNDESFLGNADDDSTFRLVDGKPPPRPKFGPRWRFQQQKQLPHRRDEEVEAKKREAEKERARRDRHYNSNRSNVYMPRREAAVCKSSVDIQPEWNMLDQIPFSAFSKLSFTVPEPEDLLFCGALESYDRTVDRITPKNERRLERWFKNRNFSKVTITTSDDPVIRRLANEDKATVFATDTILSALMCAPRSVYSWDIVVTRVGNKLFFDKRDGSPLDLPSSQECFVNPHDGLGLYPSGSRSGSGGSSRVNTAFIDFGQVRSNDLENKEFPSLDDIMVQKANSDNLVEVVAELTSTPDAGVSGNACGGIRTKMLSKSRSEYYVKNTLKGKGVIFKGPNHGGGPVQSKNLNSTKVTGASRATSDPAQSLDVRIVMPISTDVNVVPRPPALENDEISLREWLRIERPKVNKVVCLYVFKQIANIVNQFHSQGVALQELHPSFFKMLPSNEVKYVGLPIPKEILESSMDKGICHSENSSKKIMSVEHEFVSVGSSAKKQKISQSTRLVKQWPQFPTSSCFQRETRNASHFNINGLRNRSPIMYNAAPQHLTSITEQLEEKWYISPEELNEGSCTVLSNIYSLGVLLFELLAQFDSNSAIVTAMFNLRHRILPPSFLSEYAKEAGFCLWLLHPEPSSRPTTREILQSEVVNGIQEVCEEKVASSVVEDDAELELLSHFLMFMKEKKQKDAFKLMESIRVLEADVEEAERRYCIRKPLIDPDWYKESLGGWKNACKEASRSEMLPLLPPLPSSNESRLTRNIDQLESAYFSMRRKIQPTEADSTIRIDKELLKTRKNWYMKSEDDENKTPTDQLGAIFDGLCKYDRYSKFEVCGVLRNGDLNSNSNLICSLSFDRDEDYIASAGVSKKIKIYEFNALFNDSVDIHYPSIEMSNESKISCICWNNYIKNYLTSADHEGLVKLWDVSTGQEFARYRGHEQKAWSVDFSQVDPTKLASGSDDGTVKLWSINEKNCTGTIRNRNIANVCCVQFSAHSTNLLGFGSADYNTYCYDLRNIRTPWCVLVGHQKSVSYAKFLDSETLVSASTDNTLKLWDLNKTTASGPSTNACSNTLSGHTNEKNFVGLSVSDGYIACGSETNEVYAYYRSLPMPITSHKFGSIDPITGKETDEINGPFVSSICWRQKSKMVVAANSSGCIKVLQIV